MFSNINELPLGQFKRGSDSVSISDVILPPWARGSPDLFVQLHRDALGPIFPKFVIVCDALTLSIYIESEFVSQHLHEWIDLVSFSLSSSVLFCCRHSRLGFRL